MSDFMKSSARHFLVIKAAREFKKEIERAGLDALKTLADKGISIIETYLKGCSSEEKERIKRDFGVLAQMGITPDMILTELSRQMPELKPIMEGKEGYKQSEINNLELFLKSQV